MTDTTRPVSRNVLGLVAGFAFGQGTMFLAQTELLLRGDATRLGALGLGMTLITLAYGTVDFGAVVVVARHVALGSVRVAHACAVLVRLLVAAAVCVVIAVSFVVFREPAPFVSMALVGAALGLFPWAMNAAGVLDGTGRSGWSGLLGALPWISASVAAVATRGFAHDVAGFAVGGSFSAGSIVAVACHSLLVPRDVLLIPRALPSRVQLRTLARELSGFYVGWVPGQLYARAQLLLVAGLLGVSGAGAFVYVKQILSATTQLTQFVRRAEFPRLVLESSAATVIHVLRMQQGSLRMAGALTVALAVASVGVQVLRLSAFQDVSRYMLLLLPTLFVGAVAAAYGQVAVALGLTTAYATAIYVSLALGLGATSLLLPYAGFASVVVGELAMYSLQVTLIRRKLQARGRRRT